MKYYMLKPQQFGAYHFKKGEQVYLRAIKGTNSFILSKRRSQPVGPTVSSDWLSELVTSEESED